ncbi:MAG: DUF4404 family protein [Planctomycetes bacterium]|nr:DUF4404 family protein [Planctomycetota bacterium]
MNPTELQKTLETLQAELDNAESVDEATRAKLVALAEDIQRLAKKGAKESTPELEPPAAQVQDMAEQVQDLVLKFETDHPQLTTALNQVSAALANLGI